MTKPRDIIATTLNEIDDIDRYGVADAVLAALTDKGWVLSFDAKPTSNDGSYVFQWTPGDT